MSDLSLREAVVRLAHEKPELRKHLVPLLRQARSYQDYLEEKRKKGEKPLSKEDWESRGQGGKEEPSAKKDEGSSSGAKAEAHDKARAPLMKKFKETRADLHAAKKELKEHKDNPLGADARSKEHDAYDDKMDELHKKVSELNSAYVKHLNALKEHNKSAPEWSLGKKDRELEKLLAEDYRDNKG